ncbi:MAG: MBOAT family protein [Deltaproteobacteria bacterium]|nr:MBOAT family protein [Deltaproteobacteria bacterium]MDQ3300206.1 MBOAT family protein [Myxococcota bacterium]
MTFNSLTFIVFFAIVLAAHQAPLPWRVKKLSLLLASYAFYAAWNPPFVLILWLSTVIDWWAANRMYRTRVQRHRRWYLAVSIAVNLGLLGFFKYGGFLVANATAVGNWFGLDYEPATWSIVLPVGISFYTFQTMSYTLDIYLDRAKPAGSFLDFALFVTFFPQLVAGPIVRPTDLIPQFATPRRATSRQLGWGLFLVTAGLFEKIVLADGLLAPVADRVFRATELLHPADAWLGTLAFSGQIFCDFAGYTTCAIGTSLALGFSMIDNFRYPYAAIGFSDFWRRWHISLSTWLRDYLYIPLGGNRRGPVRTYVNLMLTMLIGGLWHGAAWTFVIWGGLHGVFLCVERLLVGKLGHLTWWRTLPAKLALGLLTYALVNITWVFFRAGNFSTAERMLRSMLLLDTSGKPVLSTWFVLSSAVTTCAIVASHWLMRERTLHGTVARIPATAFGLAWGAMLFLIAITQGGSSAFIYFQF